MVKTIEIDALPDDFPEEFTFRELNEWYKRTLPRGYIGMTFKQESWYRFLLRPEEQLPSMVTFRGLPIVVVDAE